MSNEPLLGLAHGAALVELIPTSRNGFARLPERFTETVRPPYGDWNAAVTMATEQALLRGRPAEPSRIVMARWIRGFCRDCGETVFEGGQGRQRTTELRCWGCGGGP